MGFFDSIGGVFGGGGGQGGGLTSGLPFNFDTGGGLGGFLSGNDFSLAGQMAGTNQANAREKAYQDQLAANRHGQKYMQEYWLNQMQAPSLTPQMETRLKALESQSQPGPLSQDPYFQGQRAQAVQGGQQALSGAQNAHSAFGTSGGFSNQGSINDVYDRLGAQLAGLGGQSIALKDQKASTAAAMRQNVADAQQSYNNAIAQAHMGIEAGDSQRAQAAIEQAYQAKEKIDAAQREMQGSMIQGVTSSLGSLFGGMFGGPMGAQGGGAAGKQAGQAVSPPSDNLATSSQGQSSGYGPSQGGSDPYGQTSPDQYAQSGKLPWAYNKGQSTGYF